MDSTSAELQSEITKIKYLVHRCHYRSPWTWSQVISSCCVDISTAANLRLFHDISQETNVLAEQILKQHTWIPKFKLQESMYPGTHWNLITPSADSHSACSVGAMTGAAWTPAQIWLPCCWSPGWPWSLQSSCLNFLILGSQAGATMPY